MYACLKHSESERESVAVVCWWKESEENARRQRHALKYLTTIEDIVLICSVVHHLGLHSSLLACLLNEKETFDIVICLR